ncbi:hypothetical protein YC2023_015264 [Brassica napus]
MCFTSKSLRGFYHEILRVVYDEFFPCALRRIYFVVNVTSRLRKNLRYDGRLTTKLLSRLIRCCGSGLSGETISENGHRWIGLDISASMLSKRYLVTWGSDYNADQNDLCDDKTMLKMQSEQRKRADKENRERRGRVF